MAFAGIDAPEPDTFRDRNTRLKKLATDLSLDKNILKWVIARRRIWLADLRVDVDICANSSR